MTNAITTAADFIRSFPQRTAERWFAARLVTETKYGQQTEAYFWDAARDCGCTDEQRESVIGLALDAGLVKSTLIPYIDNSGERSTVRHAPALRAA